jgi:hypothetical protein
MKKTAGGLRKLENRKYFLLWFDELLNRIRPDATVICGAAPERIRSARLDCRGKNSSVRSSAPFEPR